MGVFVWRTTAFSCMIHNEYYMLQFMSQTSTTSVRPSFRYSNAFSQGNTVPQCRAAYLAILPSLLFESLLRGVRTTLHVCLRRTFELLHQLGCSLYSFILYFIQSIQSTYYYGFSSSLYYEENQNNVGVGPVAS